MKTSISTTFRVGMSEKKIATFSCISPTVKFNLVQLFNSNFSDHYFLIRQNRREIYVSTILNDALYHLGYYVEQFTMQPQLFDIE